MANQYPTMKMEVTNVKPMMEIIEAAFDVVEAAQRRGSVKAGDIELANLDAKLAVVVTRHEEDVNE